eukprot:TRINITY_DN18517_c0_g1_i1.p1 TRINITY_DN18517_c0_g1~~TRINITY_DN18517_c0_g1_i1.p1  ORF type:complete len:202 (+),score=36.68 TRINITY_DN18517_c0_g1_i1:48-653(+)
MSNRTITWSPQGWLLNDPTSTTGEQKRSLTFSEIAMHVMQTVTDAEKIREEMTDSVLQNKLEKSAKLLKSSAAQFIGAGQIYNTDPTVENEKNMKDLETVLGTQHKQVLDIMREHTENRIPFSADQQKQSILREMEKALGMVREWEDQYDLMQIDADTFYTAADRLVRAYSSVIKHVLNNKGKDVQISIAKQVQAWGISCH